MHWDLRSVDHDNYSIQTRILSPGIFHLLCFCF